MNIAIFGLGYVGCISAACLAQQGHRVYGVDVSGTKVDLVNAGKSPIIEHSIDTIIAEQVGAGRLSATTDAAAAVAATELALVCVGTPSQPNGDLDLSYVRHVSEDIGRALQEHTGFYVVAVRSTMLPGSVHGVVVPALETASGKRAGQDFGVCINPEFLREGTAVADYQNPPFTLIGADDERTANLVANLYAPLDAPLYTTSVAAAEMVKYTSNAFHALKISFANEIGLLCKSVGIDSHTVMDIFTKDTQLNISDKYLKPGFAFGGSCLPKDVRAITYRAKTLDLELPVLKAILPSNDAHIEHALRLVENLGNKRVGLLGLSFKAGTDDLRESPVVTLVEKLLGKGYDLRIYDRNVSLAAIIGANKRYIEQVIPHISSLLVPEIGDVLGHAETLVVGNNAPEFREALQRVRPQQQVVDLVRLTDEGASLDNYQGICW